MLTAVERLSIAGTEIGRAREAAAKLHSSAVELEGDLQSLDGIELLAAVQEQLKQIQQLIVGTLEKLSVNAEKEAELLAKVTAKIDEI